MHEQGPKLRAALKEEARRTDAKSEALSFAQEFTRDHRLFDRLSLSTPEQRELFETHMARYWLLKENYTMGVRLRSPQSEAAAKIPLLGWIIHYDRAIYDSREEAAEELMTETSRLTDAIRETAKTRAQEIVSSPDQLGETTEMLLRQIGYPGAIQRAANLISSSYFENKNKGQKHLRRELDLTIATTKIAE